MRSPFIKTVIAGSVICSSLFGSHVVFAQPPALLTGLQQQLLPTVAERSMDNWRSPRRPADIRDEVFYFVLPDRFANGNPQNDRSVDNKFGQDGFDPTNAHYYHGGDLDGVRKQLSYLQGMGITSIWLTPVFENMPV